MRQSMDRCSECGGGPVLPLSWRRDGRSKVDQVERRCRNCGTVSTVPKEELRW
jgi:hypothetical protein